MQLHGTEPEVQMQQGEEAIFLWKLLQFQLPPHLPSPSLGLPGAF